MVKQFQKPKGNGGRQRKFVFCGKNYCFVSWFRENKPFRARIHFGSTYSIGTYSDLEECLQAIADFTREKVMESSGLEQRGWRQREEKAFSQLATYRKDKATEEEAIHAHFEAKKDKKKVVAKKESKQSLSIPRRQKLMEKTSPSIPPISLKLEPDVPPITLDAEMQDVDDYSFLFEPETLSKRDLYYNPHSDMVISPVISPNIEMDVLYPPRVLSPIVNEPFGFVSNNQKNTFHSSGVGKKRRYPFKLKFRGHDLPQKNRGAQSLSWWQI